MEKTLEKTRMEIYLVKEKNWCELTKGIWAKGGLEQLKKTRLRLPCVYISSSLTNLPLSEAANFKKHLESLGDEVEKYSVASIVPHRDTDPEKHSHICASEVYKVDEFKVSQSGLVIVDATYPSFGAGMEMEIARQHGAVIIILMKQNTQTGRMPLGHPSLIACIEYTDYKDAREKLDFVLKQFLGEK